MVEIELDSGEKIEAWGVGILFGILVGCFLGFFGLFFGTIGGILGMVFGFLIGVSAGFQKTKDNKRKKMANDALIEVNKKID